MRKFFGVTMVASLLSALLIGGALAWTTGSLQQPLSVQTGDVCASVANVVPTTNKLYPSLSDQDVATGAIANCGLADPGVSVQLAAVSGITFGPVSAPSSPECSTYANTFILGQASYDVTPIPPGQTGGLWTIKLFVPLDTPDSCQAQTLTFDATFNVETVASP